MTNATASTSPFPTRLREARHRRQLDQAALGALINIPATSISHFEAGRRQPSFDNLRKLADALHMSIDYLVGRTNNATAHLSPPS